MSNAQRRDVALNLGGVLLLMLVVGYQAVQISTLRREARSLQASLQTHRDYILKRDAQWDGQIAVSAEDARLDRIEHKATNDMLGDIHDRIVGEVRKD